MTKDSTSHKQTRKSDQYNDPSHNYLHYWDGRDYEHAAELIAIKRFLKGKHYKKAVDIGGGYGRLCVELEAYADRVVLAEPSQQQLDIAAEFLKDHPKVSRELIQAADMPYEDGSVDLVTMIRVMHHLPDPAPEFKEISRILEKNGTFILEVANNAHFKNRLKYASKGRKLPVEPVDIRSEANRNEDEIAFVNHNPKTIIKQLAHAGLRVEKVLSVSNLRSMRLKKMFSQGTMLAAERVMQPALARSFFGPSTFLLVRKK